MIYTDSSVVLASILTKDRAPPPSFWQESMASSRLLQYEVFNRIHARGADRSQLEQARILIGQISLIEMGMPMLERALEPFPVPVRTLDALHLASIAFLRSLGQTIELASYDQRLITAARAIGFTSITL